MAEIFVNLKRFDVPKRLGGICPVDDPQQWIEDVIDQSVGCGLGALDDVNLIFLLPEGLIISANNQLKNYAPDRVRNLHIGCQGVFRENVAKGGNFGAFTTNLPAAAARNMGCTWAIIGHSEERKDKFEIMEHFESAVADDLGAMEKANNALNRILNAEVISALDSGINVLFCVGETEAERGAGSFEEQKPRIEKVLKSQLEVGLQGISDYYPDRNIVIGYEPRWAIGPGKTPPGAEYIGFVSAFIKGTTKKLFGFELQVVYGGGLKEENAGMISSIVTIDGGLVALTRFTGDIAFEPAGLKKTIDKYLEKRGGA